MQIVFTVESYSGPAFFQIQAQARTFPSNMDHFDLCTSFFIFPIAAMWTTRTEWVVNGNEGLIVSGRGPDSFGLIDSDIRANRRHSKRKPYQHKRKRGLVPPVYLQQVSREFQLRSYGTGGQGSADLKKARNWDRILRRKIGIFTNIKA